MKKLFAVLVLASFFLAPSCTPAPQPDNGQEQEEPDVPVTPDTPDTPPETPETPDTPDQTPVSFRLMSFNILQATSETEGHEWSKVRKTACLKMFRDIKPDIVCIQEARKTQCSDLEAPLPQYKQVKYPKDGIESNGGQRNLILYDNSKFKLLEWDKYWFSVDGTPSGDRWGDAATTQKMTIFIKFEHKATGRVFWVYDTHFFAKCNLETSRPHCVEMSLASIKKQAGDDGTVFFCGDLNMEPSNSVLKPMFDYMQHAATDAEVSDGVNAVTYNGFRETNQKVLDHIFYRNAKAHTYKVVNSQTAYGTNWISDHYPIYADVEF
ncbi:MAG: endonuclease/exonuclease/phosphatase family protein [Bacteroidales bacterium]|nr:endonuclease/exonuclease/phosphatase family protein [Bacteroidales bacterium]